VIVTTPPVGEHPRLLFDSLYVETVLKPRMTDSTSTISFSYKDIWGIIDAAANDYFTHDTFTYYHGNKIGFPYSQPEGHPDSTKQERWLDLTTNLEKRLNILSFYYIMKDDSSYMNRVKQILLSLCNDWKQWTDPDYQTTWSYYSLLDTGRLLWGISLTYDILYNTLNNYERMNVQNAIISLGLTQTYLRALNTNSSQYPWKWPNANVIMMGGLDVGSLVTDSTNLGTYLDTARSKVDTVIKTPWVCDPAGGWSEGISYSAFAMPYLLAFMQADTVLNNSLKNEDFIENYARWRIYCMLPVDSSFAFNNEHCAEINFCDYDNSGWRWTSAMYRLAAIKQDSCAQWYIDKRPSQKKPKFIIESYLPFLWFDDDLDTLRPDSLHYVCNDIEWGILRTGWDLDDYIFAMKGDSIKSHTHYDRNSFIFGTGGRWFIEDWGYARSEGHPEKFDDYHNVVIVNNSNTVSESKGEITKFYGSNDYGYIKGDASECYDELQKWTREVIFINKGGYFAIKDWVKPYADAVDTLRWQVHSYIVGADSDSLTLNDSHTTTISKNNKHLRMEMFRPTTVSVDTVTPFPDNRVSYKRIYTEIINANGIDSLTFLTSFLPYDDGDRCPGVSEIDGGTMRGVFIDTDSTDNVILFSKRGNVAQYADYEVAVPSSYKVFNVLADLGVYIYKIEDLNEATGKKKTFNITATSEGTLSFEISGAGEHNVTVTRLL